MSSLNINPLPFVTGLDGQPLNSGSVYIGQPNLDPQANPKTVYWDAAQTLPAAQPLTTLYGRIWNAGTPAMLYTTGNYSIRVLDKNGQQQFLALNVAGF